MIESQLRDVAVRNEEVSLMLNSKQLSNDVKFDFIARVVVEAQKKFCEHDTSINKNRESLAQANDTIKLLDETVTILVKDNEILSAQALSLRKSLNDIKKEHVDSLCAQKKNELISQKCSLIHRERAAYAGGAILGLTVIGAVALAPLVMHGRSLNQRATHVQATLDALNEVPECIVCQKQLDALSNAYNLVYRAQYLVDNPGSADTDDPVHWREHYETCLSLNKQELEIAQRQLNQARQDAELFARRYYSS